MADGGARLPRVPSPAGTNNSLLPLLLLLLVKFTATALHLGEHHAAYCALACCQFICAMPI